MIEATFTIAISAVTIVRIQSLRIPLILLVKALEIVEEIIVRSS